jgi:protein TonB
MKTKKHPNANLENYSKLFAQLGLVLTLVIVYVLIQNKTFDYDLAILKNSNLIIDDTSEAIIEYNIEPPKSEIPSKKIIIDIVKQIDNDNDDFIETIIEPIDPTTPVDISQIINVQPIVDDPIEDVPFMILEDAPVFPGCKGSKEEMKNCFTVQITKFVSTKFDSNLATELNLSSGMQKIFVLFKIDSKGNVIDIQAKAPHKRLQEEAIRVVRLLPQMQPGKQRGKPVNVKYALPIAFMIE